VRGQNQFDSKSKKQEDRLTRLQNHLQLFQLLTPHNTWSFLTLVSLHFLTLSLSLSPLIPPKITREREKTPLFCSRKIQRTCLFYNYNPRIL
jgi:hypothetical protein